MDRAQVVDLCGTCEEISKRMWTAAQGGNFDRVFRLVSTLAGTAGKIRQGLDQLLDDDDE